VSADPGRLLVLRALLAVQRGGSLAAAVRRLRREPAPSAAALCAREELLKGALQWQGRYDCVIGAFSRREPHRDPVVRGVLLLSLHQLLTSRAVPAYAAMHQAGELLRAAGRPRAVGYVNALLQALRRHFEQRGGGEPLAVVRDLCRGQAKTPVDDLAAWWSHPRWLVARWCERYGDTAAAALLAHANTPPPITLHVLPGHDAATVQAELAAAGVRSERRDGYPRALLLRDRYDRNRLRDLLATQPGVLVQDAGAQAVIDWLTNGGGDLPDQRGPLIDLCAAPGGKTAHLRALLPPAASLVALDLQPRRLGRVRENLRRLQLGPVLVVAGDGLQAPLRPAASAAVLVDGPCSGTGVGRHHPEGRWRLRPQTLIRNGRRLLHLASAAADLLRDGGRLYYATCSLEPEENEAVLADLLAARADLVPDPDPHGGWQRAWLPWQTGTDGFFAARLRRRT
jgi:16S rRNA (cytosine967-C5)-methyltransferase